MSIYVSKRNIKDKFNLRECFPKKNKMKSSKKDKAVIMEFGPFEGISRIPFGGDVFGEYVINPSTEKFETFLSDELALILETSPTCVDGQNGNVLDNIIDKWLEIAVKNIDEQKNMRNIALKTIVNSRPANLKQAEQYIEYEKEELKKIDNYIIELKEKIKAREG